MHIISLKMLRTFWGKHPEAETVLRAWHTLLEHASLDDFSDLKANFGSADYVAPLRSLMWVATITGLLPWCGIKPGRCSSDG